MKRPLSFAERVHTVIRAIPRGRVASYGGVAALLGRPRAGRAVGTVLANLADGSDVPWWRVLNRNGEISIRGTLHGPAIQRAALEAEGVRFDRSGRIDWQRFGWDGSGVRERAVPDDREWDAKRAVNRTRPVRRPQSRARSR
jgi:methylated-DNA-protein-cysteine methyltransferase-like protein